ncbi:MAG: DUF5703 domain-containing protein [Bacteroidales bacterium]
MKNKVKSPLRTLFMVIGLFLSVLVFAQKPFSGVDKYNVEWTSQSKNSSESMPIGGGDIGCNVWVENGDVLFYMSRSGTFDENNTMLKLGRIRLRLKPNPFKGEEAVFSQKLNLQEGCIYISGKDKNISATIKLWVEVFRPEIHVEVESLIPVEVEAIYETWRTKDHPISKDERMQCLSFLDTEPGKIPLTTYKDSITCNNKEIIWYHRNRNDDLVFDKEVTQQRLDEIRDQLWNPLKNLTFGGVMKGDGMSFLNIVNGRYLNNNFKGWILKSNRPETKHEIDILLHVSQAGTKEKWEQELTDLSTRKESKINAWKKNLAWWEQYWNRSHIIINPDNNGENDEGWKIGRNYQLFRYMLGCNAYGEYPTKFNGSLFTVDGTKGTTPDFRMWGGGSFTAQNQRLVYWPMLKSGDFDVMRPQFEYYLRALKNAELRTQHYWGHKGASFTEQLANYGLPIGDIYHFMWGNGTLGPRPDSLSIRKLKNIKGEAIKIKDYGYLANNWAEDEYETVLEFCLMILDVERYSGQDISRYMPLIESSVVFFDEHFQYWSRKLNGYPLDENGHLIIYPSTAAETFKMAVNPTPLVAGLKTVLSRMLELPDKYGSQSQRANWQAMLIRVPPVSLMEKEGHTIIAPAKKWERVNNIEFINLYAVFPYSIYKIGKPDLDIAIDTWKYGEDEDVQKRSGEHIQKSDYCWFQSGIFCARLGLIDEARDYLVRKMLAKSQRFPAFWDIPDFDQWPDFDHGGAGMINLQEMLMQTDGKEIRLFPTWPKGWDVDFKLHAPFNTTVEGQLVNGKVVDLMVTPTSRKKDIIIN